MTTNLVSVARGLALLARFRAAGFAHLGGSAQDILASLAPLLAFPLVFGLLSILGGGDPHQLAALLAAISVLLAPLVITEALARLWGREEAWGRYAAAFNWCQWVVTLAALGVLVAANMLSVLGLPRRAAAGAALLAILAYQLGLQWFLARRGLGLSAGRSAVLVVAVEVLTSALLLLFVVLDAGTEADGAG